MTFVLVGWSLGLVLGWLGPFKNRGHWGSRDIYIYILGG